MLNNSCCCPNCFNNMYIQAYIKDNYEDIGDCSYCKSSYVQLISTKKLGIYMRKCIEKAYENCDDGTGAYYDSDEKTYCGPDGEEACTYSIREILIEEEMIFEDKMVDTTLIDDLFENVYSDRDIQQGADDPYDDPDSQNWVIKNDLYGYEQTKVYHNWENFKFVIRHYNRFFDPEGCNVREDYLVQMDPYINEFTETLSSGGKLYRARKVNESLSDIDKIEPYSKMGPPPADLAKTNRMSPAGIPYLYLASDMDTAMKECRINIDEQAIIAEFSLTKDMKILDLSLKKFFGSNSIFDPQYDHDNIWMNSFWDSFVKEVSEPVSDEKQDHSYEYAATQLVAEYYKNKGFDGICFNSSVGTGKNYVFFYGPDPNYTENAYPYPFEADYYIDKLPILPLFTNIFQIIALSKVKNDMTASVIIETKEIK